MSVWSGPYIFFRVTHHQASLFPSSTQHRCIISISSVYPLVRKMIFRSQKSLCASWPPGLCTGCPCDWTIIFLFYTFYPTARVIHIPSNIRFTMDLSKCPACLSDISLSLSPCMHAKSLQLYLTLCDPMDCSLSGFPVYGIVQARILEWVVMPSSRGSS